MSVAGIVSSFASLAASPPQSRFQTFKQDFDQLGQDLQAGNLTQAQADFAALQQAAPPRLTGAAGNPQNPLASAFSQLSQDLQSGNLTQAQSDYQTLKQDLQNAAHHQHRLEEARDLFSQLGQQLQSGNLSNAQQAYSLLAQDLPFLSGGSPVASTTGAVSAQA